MKEQIGPDGLMGTQDNQNRISRRAIVGAALGVSAAAVGLGAVAKFSSGGETASSADLPDTDDNKSVALPEARANILGLTQDPELYSDGIDPNVLIGLSYEELVKTGGIPVTDANRRDVDVLAKDFIKKYTLFLRAGGTKQDLLNEIDQGIPIGVRDDRGLLVTNKGDGTEGHAEYVNRTYGVPMLLGMGPDSFGGGSDLTPVKAALLKQQYNASGLFEYLAAQETGSNVGNPTLNTTAYIELRSVEPLDVSDGLFPGLEDARRMNIQFTSQLSRHGGILDNFLTVTVVEDGYAGAADSNRYKVLFEKVSYNQDSTG